MAGVQRSGIDRCVMLVLTKELMMQEIERTALLAERLRGCLRFNEPTSEESELEQAARYAAVELDLLAAHVKRLEAWQQEGERLLGQSGIGAAFSLGSWWADRPWRDRTA